MKKLFVIFIALSFTMIAFSQEIKISSEKTNVNGKKYYIHTIGEGQTLYSIAKAYRVTIDEISIANPKNNLTTSIKKGQSILIPYKEIKDFKTFDYTIKPGDTKYSLTKNYKLSIEEFNTINPKLAKSNDLKVGTVIKLINFKTENETTLDTAKYYYHTVSKGETISSLSRKYKVTREEIFQNNNIENNVIKIGEVITIPKKDTTSNSINNTSSLNSLAACDSINWYSYNDKIVISILLPFDKNTNWKHFSATNTKQIQKIGNLSANTCAFYYGCLIALDNFSKINNKIIVNTYDIGKDNSVIEKLFNENKLSESSFIIGPAYTSQIEFLNEKIVNSKNNNIQLILPFVNNAGILRKYPNNIIISPSNYQVKRIITKYLKEIENPNIIIVNDSDQESLKDADQMNRLITRDSTKTHNITIIKSTNIGEISKYLKKDDKNYVISFVKSEANINLMLSKLYAVLDYDITLIGEKTMLDYNSIDMQYFQKVKFTYYSHNNIDYDNKDVKTFLEKYRNTFINEANNYSFDAYDIMNYFIDMRLRYNDKCFQCLGDSFSFKGLTGEQTYKKTKQFFNNSYANRSVFLYELQEDFTFKLVYYNKENE